MSRMTRAVFVNCLNYAVRGYRSKKSILGRLSILSRTKQEQWVKMAEEECMQNGIWTPNPEGAHSDLNNPIVNAIYQLGVFPGLSCLEQLVYIEMAWEYYEKHPFNT